MTPYGAFPVEWAHWDLSLGLTADLLPVVCEPNLPLAPSSQLKAYGKVPSRFDREGRVVGFPGWTQHVTTDAEIERWSADPRLGICLQTRLVRALDVDVTDEMLASSIMRAIDVWGIDHGTRFPWRVRENSSKFLLLFALEGEHPKQILQTAGGPIEFLANGQQCLVAGCHPSGVRYEWLGGLPLIPALSLDQFRDLQALLRSGFGQSDWSEGRLRKPRESGAVDASAADAVVAYLTTKTSGLVLRVSPERVDVRCPWSESHTTGSDDTATSYFPAGTGGFETGSFRCLHAHCAQRTTRDFLDAVGYLTDGFEALTSVEGDALAALTGDEDLIGRDPLLPAPVSPLELPHFDRTKEGHIKPLLHNVVLALQRDDVCGLTLTRDRFKDEVYLQDASGMKKIGNEDYVELALRLHALRFGPGPIPSQMLRDAVWYVANKHSFDSAIDWLTTLPPWDGEARVDHFCARYLGSDPSLYATAVSRYWWTAMAGRVMVPGIQADMAIVLISTQGTGKTSTLRSLVPSPDMYVELSLADRDEELSRSMRGKLIGELAELRGIASREMEGVKAWVSRRCDEWRPKYKEFTETFPRRLVLVGTSNQEEFLADETGNRRWLPVRVGAKQDVDRIVADREQLWAEAKALFSAHSILWKEAETLARAEHYDFEIHDIWEEAIQRWLATPELDGVMPCARSFIRLEDVFHDALHIESRQLRVSDQHRLGKIMKTLGYQKVNKRVAGQQTKVWVLK